MDWEQHWDLAPRGLAATDFLRQVGKTVGGVPIGVEQFERLVAQLAEGLALEPADRVLDLCCGNGLVTRQLAGRTRVVVGVDYSAPLIDIAREHHRAPGVRYVHASVLEIDAQRLGGAEPFDKVCMYEALQHFTPEQFDRLLVRLASMCRCGTRFYLGSVPDRSRLWRFYDSPERREDYRRRVAEGREAIGTWWGRDALADLAAAHGLDCRFIEQYPELHTAHYRFDALLTWRSPA